jgi:hypothetical protein
LGQFWTKVNVEVAGEAEMLEIVSGKYQTLAPIAKKFVETFVALKNPTSDAVTDSQASSVIGRNLSLR